MYIPGAAAPVGSIRACEAYGQADRQSVNKPIQVLLVRSRPALKACADALKIKLFYFTFILVLVLLQLCGTLYR